MRPEKIRAGPEWIGNRRGLINRVFARRALVSPKLHRPQGQKGPGAMSATQLPSRDTTSNSLDDLAAEIRQMAGVTDDEADKRRLSIIYNAQETCAQCAKCGCALTPEEPVWRVNLYLGRSFLGGRRYSVAPICERCKSKWTPFRPPQPCLNCGRPVHQGDDFRLRIWTVCCDACGHAARAAIARRRRSKARGTRRCALCGETFEPKRTDALFCSPACRQRTYRMRKVAVTDDMSVSPPETIIRNADAGTVS
jgi:hypothetical protein